MDTYPINVNTKLVAVYYNIGKPNQFRVDVDVTLSNLKDQLDQVNSILNHIDTRRVDIVEYRHPSIYSNGSVRFSQIKRQNNDDVRTTFSIFGQRSSNRVR